MGFDKIENVVTAYRHSSWTYDLSSASIPRNFEQKGAFEKCAFMFNLKEGKNFNHMNTLSILIIKI